MKVNLGKYEEIRRQYQFIENGINENFNMLRTYFKIESRENELNACMKFQDIVDKIELRDKLIKTHWKAIQSVSSKIDKIPDEDIKNIILQFKLNVSNLFQELSNLSSIKKLFLQIITDLKKGNIHTTKENFKFILKKMRQYYPKGLKISIKDKILIVENDFSLFINIDSDKLNKLFKNNMEFSSFAIGVIGIAAMIIGFVGFFNTEALSLDRVLFAGVPIFFGSITFLNRNRINLKIIENKHNKLIEMFKSISNY